MENKELITKDGKELTFKQRKWLDKYLELGNATEAAMYAYDVTDRESAAQIGYENLGKLDIAEALEIAGITDKILLSKITKGLEADKPFGKNATIHADYATQHKFLETALKLKRRLVDKPDMAITGQNIQINFHPSLKMNE